MKFRRSEFALLVQALAIVLPVGALAGIALHFLREDKAAIDAEARIQAQAALPEITREFRQTMNHREKILAGAIRDGQSLAVPDYPRLPEPSAAHAQAVAEFRRLEVVEQSRDAPDLFPRAVDLARRFPNGLTESGTSVADLALLLALRHVPNGGLTADLSAQLRRRVIDHPSFLTPELVRAAGQAALAQAWSEQESAREKTRALVRTVAPQLIGSTRARVIRAAPYLAFCAPASDGWEVAFVPDIIPQFLSAVARPAAAPYTRITIQVDDERWLSHSGDSSAVLASTSGMLDGPGAYGFGIRLDLANTELLYAPYRTRRKLTEALILCSAGTALIGLASLWVSYRRQARLSEMKSNFVSSVSHELRAPLGAVRLMAESLESGRVQEASRRQDYYHLIVEECRRLSGLVENVLDLARIRDGRKQYHFEPVDLMALVRQSVALMEPYAADRQVTLRLIGSGSTDWQPSWDGQAVEQSLVNLLDNAIKHSPPGGEVQVDVEREAGAIRLWVEDHGSGIPPKEQKRIFELFYRHGPELRRETQGAGIGLSIVRHVAEAHGGRVIVDSEVGRGSRFGLELPVEQLP